MANADPVIELSAGASPARRFKQIRLQAAAFAGYIDRGRDGFTLTARLLQLSRFEVNELVAIVTATWGWKHSTATVDGRQISKFDLASAVQCWRLRVDAPARKQAKHCGPPGTRGDKGTVPDAYAPPCKMHVAPAPVRWEEYAPGGITDHAAMEAAMIAAAAAHPLAWCPAFNVEPALVEIRKLPRSRQRVRERERRRREQIEAAWVATRADLSRRLLELRELEATAAWLELIAERVAAHGVAVLSRDDCARLADETGLPNLRDVPDAALMSDFQRTQLLARLRELLVDDGAPD